MGHRVSVAIGNKVLCWIACSSRGKSVLSLGRLCVPATVFPRDGSKRGLSCSSFARARGFFWTKSSTVAVQMKDFRFGGVWIFVFEAGLKTPTTTAGHGGRDYCGRSGLRLSEASHESIREGDGELGHRLRPVPGTATPVCGDVLQRHPDQLGCGLIAREVSSGLDDLAQPRIDAPDRICGVDHATYRRGKGKERNDPNPCSTPQRRDGRIPLTSGAVLEFLECFQGRFRVGRGVDRSQRLSEDLAVLPARVFEAVTD